MLRFINTWVGVHSVWLQPLCRYCDAWDVPVIVRSQLKARWLVRSHQRAIDFSWRLIENVWRKNKPFAPQVKTTHYVTKWWIQGTEYLRRDTKLLLHPPKYSNQALFVNDSMSFTWTHLSCRRKKLMKKAASLEKLLSCTRYSGLYPRSCLWRLILSH